MSLDPEVALSVSEKELLIAQAKEALNHAYAPYSQFNVGAAVLTDSGKIYSGCNIENASYGLTICAERVAVFSAIAHEGPSVRLKAIALTSKPIATTPPCGACRQVLAEFAQENFLVLFPKSGNYTHFFLSELLPEKFSLLF